jgi:uncharacterized protein
MEILKEKIKHHFDSNGHKFDHIQRVYHNALDIAKVEGGDLEVIKASSLLHDIARKKEKETGVCHAQEGARMAPSILREINFPEEKIPKVVHCIAVHRYRHGLKPETKEAAILQDADRLDAIGAVAITRVILHDHNRVLHDPEIKPEEETKENETTMNHFYKKILKLTPEAFNTETARKMAKERYNFTKEFVDRFAEEWKN